jgi:hypothetical protein
VKRRKYASSVVRLVGRVTTVCAVLLVVTLFAIQFARVIWQNVELSHELALTRTNISSLRARRDWEIRQLRRLATPEGSIPEIHERLRLVRRDEAIIFLSPAPSAAPTSAP